MSQSPKYPWFSAGDLGAFFGLMLDNVTNLVLLTMLLAGFQHNGVPFPRRFIFTHMIPGAALGVMFGDLVYTWMARRLARRTGRTDVTAMPLGLDTPSTMGIALVVLGPVYAQSGDPMAAWQVGMATMIFMGLVKLALSFAGGWVQRIVPRAGLLGSLAGVGIALMGFLPLTHIFALPVAGMVALGLVLYTLVARLRLPGNLPGAAVAVLGGTLLYYVMGQAGALGAAYTLPGLGDFGFTPPIPTLGFLAGLGRAVDFLPVAIPFGLLTIVGGINNNESARVAGDEYRTRDILLTEAVATLVAGLTGGVSQSTPYIGHPAYKRMGGRSGYTLACGLFIGLGGAFGLVSFIVGALPSAAVAPILVFVGLAIATQAFEACPQAHYPAVVLSLLPSVGYLALIQWNTVVSGLQLADSALPAGLARDYSIMRALGDGFILTAMLWGALGAKLVDRKLPAAAIYLGVCAAFSLFGVIHSVDPRGSLYLPWTISGDLHWHIAWGYAAFALLLVALNRTAQHRSRPQP
jgi:AGZA family xanthine/uracil permease-like MFS transporter